MFPYYQIAQLVSGPTGREASHPWFMMETNLTSDGPRTRLCDGRWKTKEEALADMERRIRKEKE
jgi:hypothetical protein